MNFIGTFEINYKKDDFSQDSWIRIFDGLLTVNQTFSQTEIIIGKSDFAHIICVFINQNPDLCEVWKYYVLKDGFRSI